MKLLLLLGVFFLTGCVSMPTLEELEEQASLSGDWSAVEKREKLIAKRELLRGPQCPAGRTAYCEQRLGQKRCGCISNSEMRALLSWRR
jgi:hypothetical protein